MRKITEFGEGDVPRWPAGSIVETYYRCMPYHARWAARFRLERMLWDVVRARRMPWFEFWLRLLTVEGYMSEVYRANLVDAAFLARARRVLASAIRSREDYVRRGEWFRLELGDGRVRLVR